MRNQSIILADLKLFEFFNLCCRQLFFKRLNVLTKRICVTLIVLFPKLFIKLIEQIPEIFFDFVFVEVFFEERKQHFESFFLHLFI